MQMWHALARLLAALAVAAGGLFLYGGISYEEALIERVAAYRGCAEESELQSALCAAYGEYAVRAASKYPKAAETVYELYGGAALLRSVEESCRTAVIPVIAHFVEEPQLLLELGDKWAKTGNELVNALRDLRWPQLREQFVQLTPEERGWLGLRSAALNCDLFMAQFAVTDAGGVNRLETQTAFVLLQDIALGGLLALERKSALGESLEQADWIAAGADVVGIAAVAYGGKAVAALFKARHAGTAARAARLRALSAAALVPVKAAGKAAAKGALIGAGGYLIVAHPQYVTAIVGEAGNLIGLPRWAAQLLFWLMLAGLCYFVIRPLARALLMAGRGCAWLLRPLAASE